MGRLYRLQKLALAGNKLTSLPASMANCQRLELARLSANAFVDLPNWLFGLPKLSWLAIDGNPLNTQAGEFSVKASHLTTSIPLIKLEDIALEEVIGQGASGIIYRAKWRKQPHQLAGSGEQIAVKIFKGEVTSDGYPSNELENCLQAGHHDNLIKVIGQINQADGLGLVMELIPNQYANLGLPPSLKTCTRDTFHIDAKHNLTTILLMLQQMASGLTHLHHQHVSHGDIYAHNTMYNPDAAILFGDFGAATDLNKLPSQQREAMQRIEVRAFGCLMEDLLEHCCHFSAQELDQIYQATKENLVALKGDCLQKNLALRPQFSAINQQLQQLISQLDIG
nr:leucine-rich repeat-containing protein kinase family protein [Vibrio ichthyoenteri]